MPFAKLIGHTNSVEDVVFKPDSAHELVSVGIDKKVLLWDTRVCNKKERDMPLSQNARV